MANEPKQDIKRYLEYPEYPATTFDLVTAAENNGAPAEIVDRLNQLPNDAEFSDPNQVVEQLENIEGSGKPTPEHEVA
jgi:Protein of unknown function (DUF2795)